MHALANLIELSALLAFEYADDGLPPATILEIAAEAAAAKALPMQPALAA
jgi:hypothetical protein